MLARRLLARRSLSLSRTRTAACGGAAFDLPAWIVAGHLTAPAISLLLPDVIEGVFLGIGLASKRIELGRRGNAIELLETLDVLLTRC